MKIIANAGFMKDVMELLSPLLIEAQLDVSSEGLRLQQMDPSNVALTVLSLPKENFEELEGEDYLRFVVKDVQAIVKRAGDDDKFVMEIAPGGLRLTIEGKRRREFGLPHFGKEETVRKKPVFEPECRAMVSTEGLATALQDAEIVVGKSKKEAGLQYVNLVAEDVGITMKAEKEGTFKFSKSRLLPGWDIMDRKGGGADAIYGMLYLKPIVDAVSKICGMVKLEWSTNMPIKMDCMLPFKGSLTYYLAPRIPIEREERVK